MHVCMYVCMYVCLLEIITCYLPQSAVHCGLHDDDQAQLRDPDSPGCIP